MFHQEMEYGFFLAANYPWLKSSMNRGFAGRVFFVSGHTANEAHFQIRDCRWLFGWQ